MFKFFDHHNTGAFTHHETITVFIKGTGSVSRVIVAAAQSVHIVKASHADRADARIGATGHHHIGITTANDPAGFTDSMKTGCASRHMSDIRTF